MGSVEKKPVILVADQQRLHADLLAELLGDTVRIEWADTLGRAVDFLQAESLSLVLYDVNLNEGTDEFALLEAVKARRSGIPVMITAASPSIEVCKQAMRRGVWDFLVKPISADQLGGLVRQAIGEFTDSVKVEDFAFHGIQGRSPLIQSVFRILRRVAPTDLSILIEGESGTGKELTARAIHENSKRKKQPFYPLNCAGLAETLLESELFGHAKGAFTGAMADRKGLFQLADGGTLFLDEIGDMPLTMQAKLLRVLEDGIVRPVGGTQSVVVDVRVISATNHDLADLVDKKKFRQDLYFRIKEVAVTIPPLRKRPQDIPELFGYFLREACEDTGRDIHLITEPAMRSLMAHPWPGNIRQLRNVVRTMVVMCEKETLDLQDLPPEISRIKRLEAGVPTEISSGQSSLLDEMAGKSLEEVECEHIRRTLHLTHNNRAEAARILKIGERTLYRKIKEYNL